MERHILAVKRYSTHKDDGHLSIVLCLINKGMEWEYVTWIRNMSSRSKPYFTCGRYFDSSVEALQDFCQRGSFDLRANECRDGAHFMDVCMENVNQWTK